jgi:fucose permease
MNDAAPTQRNLTTIRWLTFFMFMMFAMTTDSVGVIIPQVIKEYRLSMTVAGAFHYVTMSGIALAGILLGYLADKLGRKTTIILGLILFALSSYLFAAGRSFPFFLALLLVSGIAIGIFKTGALALIGDITRSTTEHTSTMNIVEGFFAVGAIAGPAIVAHFLAVGTSWKWLYIIAATLCVVLIATASLVRYPQTVNYIRTCRSETHLRNDEESVCPRLFGSNLPLCHRRGRSLCMDAHVACRLPGVRKLDGSLRHFDLFRPPRGRKIHWLMDARSIELGCRRDRV